MTTMVDRFTPVSDETNVPDETEEQSFTLKGVVKWFDTTKGYGFIVPDDNDHQGGDVLIHSSCLKAAGRESAREGAKVACEVVRRSKGLQALKLLDIDETDAAPIAAQAAALSQTPAGDFVRAQVKWFNRAKGYGFLTRGEGTSDIFIHMETVRSSGLGELQQGQRVQVSFGEGAKGLLAIELRPDPEN
ncbi:MAG: cold shock domain-containing protein [Pseudomonadota bacterium]